MRKLQPITCKLKVAYKNCKSKKLSCPKLKKGGKKEEASSRICSRMFLLRRRKSRKRILLSKIAKITLNNGTKKQKRKSDRHKTNRENDLTRSLRFCKTEEKSVHCFKDFNLEFKDPENDNYFYITRSWPIRLICI